MRTLPTDSSTLLTVLERARTAGFLGPGPLSVHVANAQAFSAALDLPPFLGDDRCELSPKPTIERILDLGSGGGVPGLPIALDDPQRSLTLVDTSAKRCAFLEWAVVELDLASQVTVLCARAEEASHDPALRHRFDAVVARGFAQPAETVECGAGFLRIGGRMVISEPPGGRTWNADPLGELGVAFVAQPTHPGGLVVVLEQRSLAPSAIPRPWRQQQKRPYLVV